MIVPGILVCSSFLISVCMFIVSKALLISSDTVIVRARGPIWLNPFATMLLLCVVQSLYSVMLCTRVARVCLECLLLCKEEGSSPVSLCMYEVPLSMSLLGFGMGKMLTNIHMCGNFVRVKSGFQHAREECESKRAYAC